MLDAAKAISSLLLIALVGCASHPRYVRHVPDWENEEIRPTTTVIPQESPIVSAPAPIVPVAPAPAPKRPIETWVPLNRWCQESGLAMPVRLPDTPMPTYTVKSAR